MSWSVTFFNKKVYDETYSFPKGILADFIHILDMIEQYGPTIGMPYTKPMGKGLFEIRSKGKEGMGRSLFCTVKGQEIIVLHSFVKKTQKTPKREIDLARKRMKEIL